MNLDYRATRLLSGSRRRNLSEEPDSLYRLSIRFEATLVIACPALRGFVPGIPGREPRAQR